MVPKACPTGASGCPCYGETSFIQSNHLAAGLKYPVAVDRLRRVAAVIPASLRFFQGMLRNFSQARIANRNRGNENMVAASARLPFDGTLPAATSMALPLSLTHTMHQAIDERRNQQQQDARAGKKPEAECEPIQR